MASTQVKQTAPPKRYNFKQLEQLWIKNGGDTFIAPVMAAIALAESSGIPTNTGHYGAHTYRGLWQIQDSHGYGTSSYDPNKNAQQAISLYRSSGLTQWQTFTTGRYLQFLQGYSPKQKTDINNFLQKNPQIGGDKGPAANPPSILTKTIHATEKPLVKPLTHAGDTVASAIELGLKEAMYGVAIFGGAMLILLGLLFIGVDIGLSSLSNRATSHPVVKLANRVTPTRKEGGSGGNESSGDNNLPGPEE